MDTNTTKKFSVMIPVYNTGQFLERCLDSVLNQSFQDFEIVLVDDGSTDLNTIKICDRYGENEKIKVVHKDNEGLLITRRRAMQYCEGEYFCFLDSDDYWNKNLLWEVNSVIEEYHCDLVLFRFKREGTRRNAPSPKLFRNKTIFDESNKNELFQRFFDRDYLTNIWLKVAKREIVDMDKDYSPYKSVKYGEDKMHSIPLLCNANRIGYIAKPLYYYCYNPESITRKRDRNEPWERYEQLILREIYIEKTMKDLFENIPVLLQLFYVDNFYSRICITKSCIGLVSDVSRRKEYIEKLFTDEMSDRIKRDLSKEFIPFRLRGYYKDFKRGIIIDKMLKKCKVK
jgi:glycosyltransferase involved in cell wall biosynthesis